MAFFVWPDDLRAGVPVIGEQHHRFFALAEQISIEAMHFLRSGLETHIKQRDMVWASEGAVPGGYGLGQFRANGLRDVLT